MPLFWCFPLPKSMVYCCIWWWFALTLMVVRYKWGGYKTISIKEVQTHTVQTSMVPPLCPLLRYILKRCWTCGLIYDHSGSYVWRECTFSIIKMKLPGRCFLCHNSSHVCNSHEMQLLTDLDSNRFHDGNKEKSTSPQSSSGDTATLMLQLFFQTLCCFVIVALWFCSSAEFCLKNVMIGTGRISWELREGLWGDNCGCWWRWLFEVKFHSNSYQR